MEQFFLAITITGNAIEATAPNVDYRSIIPILVMGGVLLIPLIRGRRIVRRIMVGYFLGFGL